MVSEDVLEAGEDDELEADDELLAAAAADK
jgi:hypothetical protein